MIKLTKLVASILLFATCAFAQDDGPYQTNRVGVVVGNRSSNNEVIQAQGPLLSADGTLRLSSRFSLIGDMQFTWWSAREMPLKGKATTLTGLFRAYPTSRFQPIFMQGGLINIRNKVAGTEDTDTYGVVGVGINAKRRMIAQLNYVLGPQRGFYGQFEYHHVVGTSPLEFRAKARVGKLVLPLAPTGGVYSDIGVGIGINLDALRGR